ncbi:MAG: C10 family peptidase, partial [Chlamydiia bacterium]|nr:C10 family peptidase [Chlamydiia bacterium]
MRIIKNTKLPKVLLVFLFVLSSITITAQTYGPYLTDVWGGVNCVDDTGARVNPTNYYTPSNCSAGCVAISLAQVLNYYEWPKTGTGNQVYSDNYSGSLKRHSAFFDSVEYDYANMLDEYMRNSSNDTEQKAVGELMYHTASALQMNFEPTGS